MWSGGLLLYLCNRFKLYPKFRSMLVENLSNLSSGSAIVMTRSCLRHGLCRRLCIRAPAHVSFVSFTFLSPLRDGTSEILSIHVSPQGSRSPLKYFLHSVKLKVKLKDKGQGPPMNTNSRAKYRSEFVDFQKLSNKNNFVNFQSTASN